MKEIEFTDDEFRALLKVLRYYVDNLSADDNETYMMAKGLLRGLAPKKVTKEGWIVVYADGSVGLYLSAERARQASIHNKGSQVIKIFWEQEQWD